MPTRLGSLHFNPLPSSSLVKYINACLIATPPPCTFMGSEQDSNSMADGDTNRTTPVVFSYDCPHNSPDSRNLVVCIDGTANQFGLQVKQYAC